jgi:hypothetical protein
MMTNTIDDLLTTSAGAWSDDTASSTPSALEIKSQDSG